MCLPPWPGCLSSASFLLLWIFLKDSFLNFYWCIFICLHTGAPKVQKRVSDTLGFELQVVVSRYIVAGNKFLTLEDSAHSTSESSLQPLSWIFETRPCYQVQAVLKLRFSWPGLLRAGILGMLHRRAQPQCAFDTLHIACFSWGTHRKISSVCLGLYPCHTTQKTEIPIPFVFEHYRVMRERRLSPWLKSVCCLGVRSCNKSDTGYKMWVAVLSKLTTDCGISDC